MTEGIKTVMYPVSDLASAKKIYGALLGVEPYADAPYYVGFNVGGQDVGLDPNGHSKGMTGPVGYWHVDDIEASLQIVLAEGATILQEITDVGGGKLIAMANDQDGNIIGLLQQPR
jgi:predicted enzyme related to lactoylglutathione lyase